MACIMTSIPSFVILAAAAIMCLSVVPTHGGAPSRRVVDLSGAGWRLWLDRKAAWQEDALLPPPVDIARLPSHAPSGGWESLRDKPLDVSTPGTVEGYLWDEIGDYVGVSWWSREVELPAIAAGMRVILQFEAVRLRAEVFMNERLVGYDAVGNTPFECDITDAVAAGKVNQLAVRVTDPGGNFDWMDFDAHHWGRQTIPASHGFGGVTGSVRVLIVEPVFVQDIFVRNKPDITAVDVEVIVRNTTASAVTRALSIEVLDRAEPARRLFSQTWNDVTLAPGETTIVKSVSAPAARPWSPDDPQLHVCRVTLGEGDQAERRFGFRWFAPEGIGSDAVFRLNGRRIVLRSAISWGFWPGNGITPTREMAEKQIRAAKALGLNMLNFHRCIGQPVVLDAADELGLLYYEEPGGYTAHGGDERCFRFAREKLLRMVRRDRSHPSLVIYSMINEETNPPQERHRQDMADAHRLDPSRTITYTSGWNKAGDDPTKLHMRPYDDRPYTQGWTDEHHACGPGCYRDEHYRSSEDYYLRTQNKGEIVFWGEEGAVAAPPRLQLIREALGKSGNGWDGADYQAWYAAYAKYLADKKLTPWFASVDAITQSLGNVTYHYQGRAIENARLGNLTDGYVINGWECEKQENHSGIVDCFRHFKGDPAILAYYNAPLYVAVKLSPRVTRLPAELTVDFHIINERGLRGAFELRARATNAVGKEVWTGVWPVSVTGGETFGEPLKLGVKVSAATEPGRFTVRAALHARDERGAVASEPCAVGYDDAFLVDWKSRELPRNGAILETGSALSGFLREQKGLDLPAFTPQAGQLGFVVVGDMQPEPRVAIPRECLRAGDARDEGLRGEYFRGMKFAEPLLTRTDATVDFDFTDKGPDARVGPFDFCVRWTGRVLPTESGPHRFHTQSDDGVRVWVDGKKVIDDWNFHEPKWNSSSTIDLVAGREVPIHIEYFQGKAGAVMRLHWTTPAMFARAAELARELVRRAREDGATVLILRHADTWASLLGRERVVVEHGWMKCGEWWLGGGFFVREHPLFAGLPVNGAMDWEYQCLVHYGAKRFGLLLDGEEAVVGCVTGHEHKVATAVGVVPCGRGRIVLSTLDLLSTLNEPPGPADVGRSILCNFIAFAGKATK